MTKEENKALAKQLCRIVKPLAHELLEAIGDNRVLVTIRPDAGIAANINGSTYLVSWPDLDDDPTEETLNQTF